MVAGNLARAVRSARAGVKAARESGLLIPLAGSLTNLGALMVATGNLEKARTYLDTALSMTDELVQVRFSVLDSLAQLQLFVGDNKDAQRHLDLCEEASRIQTLPARSWYDLAHQVHAVRLFRADRGLGRHHRHRRNRRRRTRATTVQGDPHRAPRCQGPRLRPPRPSHRCQRRARRRCARLPPWRRRPAHRPRGVQGAVRLPSRRRRQRQHPLRPRASPRAGPSGIATMNGGSTRNARTSRRTHARPCR